MEFVFAITAKKAEQVLEEDCESVIETLRYKAFKAEDMMPGYTFKGWENKYLKNVTSFFSVLLLFSEKLYCICKKLHLYIIYSGVEVYIWLFRRKK